MPSSPRRLRPCRPAPEPLEGLAPVSTLLLDIPTPDATAVGRPTPASGRRDRPRARPEDAPGADLGLPDITPRPTTASPPAAPSLVRLAGPPLATAAPTTAATARPIAGLAAGLADPHAPSALIAPPPGPSAAAQPAGAAAAPVVVSLTPSARPAPTPAMSPTADADGIRPMTLAPPADTGGAWGPYQTFDGGTGGGPGSSSGSGGGPGSGSGTNPIVSWQTIDGFDASTAPHYKSTTGVPIGRIVNIHVIPPSGLSFQTIAWAGGSNNLYSLPGADAAAPQSFVVSTPATNQATYSFVVTSLAPGATKDYTITCNATYNQTGPGGVPLSGAIDVKFTAYAPTMAELHVDQQGQARNYVDPAGRVGLIYAQDATMPFHPDGAGIVIRAETQAGKFPGSFMFQQVVLTRRYITRAGGAQYYAPKWPTAPYDPSNGILTDWNHDAPIPAPWGYTLAYATWAPNKDDPGQLPNALSWHLAANERDRIEDPTNPSITYPRYTGDSPGLVDGFGDATQLRVGSPSGGVEEFRMFLMYRPDGASSTWVPMEHVYWTWGGTRTKNPNGTWGNVVVAANPPALIVSDAGQPPNIWSGRTWDIVTRPPGPAGFVLVNP